MIEAPETDVVYSLTDGYIAANNLESARRQSWSRFWLDSLRPGIAEYIVEQEQLTLQFLGDLGALDRLGKVIDQLDRVDAESSRTALIHAHVAATTHRFVNAKNHLAKVAGCPELTDAANRLSLSIDQACGTELESVLDARRQIAAHSGRLEDLVPLGALHADLREFAEAERIYQRALKEYRDVSPFPVAWVCFQLGVLWGELVPEPQLSRAAYWYRKAIEYVPRYVKARVHLAEIRLRCRRIAEAEALLLPVVASGDPEVCWRLADVMIAMKRFTDAEVQMHAARSGFEALLGKHLLAFADHGAEFYAGSGNNPTRAFELASANLKNRPTLRAFEQAFAIAVDAAFSDSAAEILTAAKERWGATAAFKLSSLAADGNDCFEEDANLLSEQAQ
jgi:hypothetical protein